MSTQDPQQPQFSEEELRAIEAEMQKITVDDVLLQTIVTLLNVGARKSGLAAAEGQPAPEPDLEQVHQAIEAARALLPLVEPRHGAQLGPVKDALSRLQMFYAQRAGGQAPAPGGEPPAGEPEAGKEGPGPAQSSGRLWVPGQ
jgi:hypothetical protein